MLQYHKTPSCTYGHVMFACLYVCMHVCMCVLMSVCVYSCLLCRELAFQIADQFQAFGKGVNVRDVVIVGGMGMPLSLAGSICDCANSIISVQI